MQQSGTERLSSVGQVHELVRHVPVRVSGRLQGPVDRKRSAQRPDLRDLRPRPVQSPGRMLLPGRTAGVQVSTITIRITYLPTNIIHLPHKDFRIFRVLQLMPLCFIE